MSRLRRFALFVLVVASLAAGACGDPPEKEMQQAQAAIDAARVAGADHYAREEFTAAQEALKRAREAVDQRDYRQALNQALDSRERAQSAVTLTADHKAAARTVAGRALADASVALNDARVKLRAAEAAHVAAAKLADARAAIAAGDRALQKARASVDQGDYLAVPAAVTGEIARLRATAHDLDAMVASPTRRRR